MILGSNKYSDVQESIACGIVSSRELSTLMTDVLIANFRCRLVLLFFYRRRSRNCIVIDALSLTNCHCEALSARFQERNICRLPVKLMVNVSKTNR